MLMLDHSLTRLELFERKWLPYLKKLPKQGCNSIEISILRLELGCKLRQGLRVRLGTHFLAITKYVPGCKRRAQTRLGCTRVPSIEPMGASREDFYECKLVLGLPWYCSEKPQVVLNEEGHVGKRGS